MKNLIYFFLLIFLNSFSQNSLDKLIKKYNTESIPYISVNSLNTIKNDVVLLDAREQNEYDVSHLKNAVFVGYDSFNLKKTLKKLPNKNTKIVVYCSLGIRSEEIAEKLKKVGYTNVLNLYGGIFEWKNNNYNVFSSEGKATEKVHTFSEEWKKWLLKGEKIY